MKRIIVLFVIFCFLRFACFAAKVDTVAIYSSKMKRDISCAVITPDSYSTNKTAYPVVYLLHGFGGDYANWSKRVPSIKKQADELQMIIVCPDGGYSSWYFDSPVDSSMRYETYIAEDVPTYIDDHYRTIKNKHARAITGLSMGGHGAMFITLRHPQLFGACGSMSGGVDLLGIHYEFDIKKRLGDSVTNNKYWKDNSVIKIIETYKPKDSLAIIIDCGISDIFYTMNHQLHDKMLMLKIPHDYIERPGEHNWDYWANAIQYQLLYFRNYFNKYYK